MKSLAEFLELAARSHGHMCPGQVLGVRIAMRGLRELRFDDPSKFRKRLVTFVEIDRCATDAISLVTGCRLGKRSLKFLDYGKVAATFLDLETRRAVRVLARDDSRAKAKSMFPDIAEESKRQIEAYKVMDEAELFVVENVEVNLPADDLPGGPRTRVACDVCGEGINHGRERRVSDRVLCRSCAGENYYRKV
jgi:formylmethanofuran dehydrogenase subunit E